MIEIRYGTECHECGVSMVMVMVMAGDGDGFLDGGDTSTWQIFRGKLTGENGGKKELELVKMAGNKKILPSENPKSKTPADGRRRRRRRRRFQ